MSRRLLATVMLIAMSAGSWSVVTAQETATPQPGFEQSSEIVNVDGSVLGDIQVTDIDDAFALYDSSTPPNYGMRYVAVTMDIHSTGERPWTFNSTHLVMVDDDGYAVTGSNPRFSEESRIALLANQDIAPGATLTGSIVFQVALGAKLNWLVYSPANDRLVTVSRFGPAPPAIGAPVSVLASDGSVIADITVSVLVNPFTGYEQDSPPERGADFVLITVSVTNPGPRLMRLDPQAFLVIDTDGFAERPVTIRRGDAPPPELTYTDSFTAGSSTSGGLGYLVLSGVGLDRLVYSPSNDRLVEIADLG
ncbi:hypothetical protein BH20CHL4_BH20CHL4_15010 [soil metagenome]